MKHFAIVIPCNTHWAPFCLKYQSLIAENGHTYDLIIWNREGISEDPKFREGLIKVIEFDKPDICNDGRIQKVPNFIRFSEFVRKKLTEMQYDGIFFLTTAACTVALNARFLLKNYWGKYWIDVRDCSYEWFPPYYSLLKKAIRHSYAVSISSRAYQSFLPKGEYIISHNIDPNLETYRKTLRTQKADIIRISYIGNIAYLDENKKLIDRLKNDSRYQLQYYGSNAELLQQYCEQSRVENTDFFGRFPYEQTGLFYEKTDIINNVYGSKTKGVQTAISNKMYYAIALAKPIITSPNTYTAEIATAYGFGFVVDFLDTDWPNKLYDWYNSLRTNQKQMQTERLWQMYSEENAIFEKKVAEYLNRSIEENNNNQKESQ